MRNTNYGNLSCKRVMRFMVIVKATQESEAGIIPSTQLLTEMGAYNEELVNTGILLAGDGLHPNSKVVRMDEAHVQKG